MATRDGMFDEWDPGNVAPVVAYLASTACRFNGETFFVRGGTVQRVRSWELAESVRCEGAWSVDELADGPRKPLTPMGVSRTESS